jgi:hypothetical protein
MDNLVFLSIQLTSASVVFYLSPLPKDMTTILVFLILLPSWLYMTYKQIPKNLEIWKQKFIFVVFIGFGISVMTFTLQVVGVLFLTAATGKPYNTFYFYSFPLMILTSKFIGLKFHQGEMFRYIHHGLNYNENMVIDEGENGINIAEFASMDETLRQLTILNLEPDVTMEELKKRYLTLAQLFHPDRLEGMSEQQKLNAEEEFKRIKKAYEIVKAQIENNRL